MTNVPGGATKDLVSSLKDWLALIIGVLALVGFTAFVVFLLDRLTSSDLQWTRAIYLFSGVEAIAFAAAGYFFGREVHRERAEKAEVAEGEARQGEKEAVQQATDAEKKMVEAESKARSMVAAIKAKTATHDQRVQSFASLPGNQVTEVTRADLEELRRVAQELFPGT